MKIALFSSIVAATLGVAFTVGLHINSAQAAETESSKLFWTTDYSAAVKKAKEEKKMVLLDFTGKGWCGWCTRLKKEVFETAEFKDYAKANLILVELNFPYDKPPSDQNIKLSRKHGVQGFPTILVLDGNEKVLAKLGYQPGGPGAWLGELNRQIKN